MPLLQSLPEPVSFEEVAAVLDEAAIRARGGSPCIINAAGWLLAAILDAAGFCVVRAPSPSAQMTL